MVHLEELFSSAPTRPNRQTKSEQTKLNNQEPSASCSRNAASSNRVDSVEEETSLIKAVYLDRKAELAAQTKSLAGGELDRATASKLLHLCCNFDSAECAAAILGGDLGEVPLVNEYDDSGRSPLHTAASAHAARCVEVLLQNHARTDLRTKDGQAQLALQLSLADTSRVDINWNPNDFSIEDLVIQISEKDLRTVKLLSEKTKEAADVAYNYAVKGHIASLTALRIAAGDKVYDCVLEQRHSEWGCKEKATIYECLIWEALALGGRAAPPLRAAKRASTASKGAKAERRKALLREVELLQMFGAVAKSTGGDKKATTSPLIRAAQGGDETVIRLLLQTEINVNDADAEGNTALHWILKLSRSLCPQQIKIVSLLLDHGARESQRNRLGLTAFHIAAGNDDSEALEVLLLKDPFGVQYKTDMKETLLFIAVKSESKECAKLLLTWGANSEVLNLRLTNRGVFDGNLVDPLARLAAPSDPSMLNGLPRKEQRHKRFKEVVKKTDILGPSKTGSAKLPKYSMGSLHGTTIVWIRVSPTKLLFGVDSQKTQTYTANDPKIGRSFELLKTEDALKFIKIIGNVYASLCGDADRCHEMARNVVKQIFEQKKEPNLFNVGELATAYFRDNPMNTENEFPSEVFLCEWKLHEKKYQIDLVGDKYDKACTVLEEIFGSGSGSYAAMNNLKSMRVPKDENALVKEMIIAAGTDTYTGGFIRVFSLECGLCTSFYLGSLAHELYLYNPVYEDMFYDRKHMFVIILTKHADILSPSDFPLLLERFDNDMHRRRVQWLCLPCDAQFIVYMVRLSSEECAANWFHSCKMPGGPVRCDKFTNAEKMDCGYCLGYASREVLNRARSMKSFKDLFRTKTIYV